MMKKRTIATAALLAVGLSAGMAQAAVSTASNNFTMLDGGGGSVGGNNDTTFDWNETFNTNVATAIQNASFSSATTFFGQLWTAHDAMVYGPGTYAVDTVDAGMYNFTVGTDQAGAHLLFDWGTNFNIDVVLVWDMDSVFAPGTMWTTGGGDAAQVWDGMSIDWDADGTNGGAMVDGAFVGFHANFNVMGVHLDTTSPVVTLLGDNSMIVDLNDPYSDPGATATDGACLPAAITPVVGGDVVDPGTVGTYNVTYTATDCYGNTAVETRVVNVVGQGPVVTLTGDAEMSVLLGTSFTDPGYICNDEFDVEYTVTVAGDTVDVDTLKENPGYIITYDCTDGLQNAEQKTREVNVIDNNPPVISVSGDTPATVECGVAYTDAGATCEDPEDGSLQTVDVNNVVIDTVGSYIVDYTCTDNDGADDTDSRDVNVVDTTTPLITRLGDEMVEVKKDDIYTDAGATCMDSCEGSLSVTVDNPVDTSTEGTYTVIYTCSDGTNHVATQVTRTVEVGGCELAEGGSNYSNFSMFDTSGALVGGSTLVTFEWDGTLNVWELPDPMLDGYTAEDFYIMDPPTNGNYVTNPVANAKMTTGCTFFGKTWVADPTYMYGPGVYEFVTCPEPIDKSNSASWKGADGSTFCGNPDPSHPELGERSVELSLEVPEGKIGSHMLFEWNNNLNIDMINVYDFNVANSGQQLSSDCGSDQNSQVWNLTSTDVEGDGITGHPFVEGPFVGFQGNMYLMLPGSEFIMPSGPPVLEISGDNPLALAKDAEFTCPDAVGVDLKDGEVCDDIKVSGCDDVATSTPGSYTVNYEVTDSNGNTATEDLLVVVIGESGDPETENDPVLVLGASADAPAIVLIESDDPDYPHPLQYVCENESNPDGAYCTGNEPGDVIIRTVVNYNVGVDENEDTVCDDYIDPGASGYDLQDGELSSVTTMITFDGVDYTVEELAAMQQAVNDALANKDMTKLSSEDQATLETKPLCKARSITVTYTVTDNGGNPEAGVTAQAADGALSTTATRVIQVNAPLDMERGNSNVPAEPKGSSDLSDIFGCSATDTPVNPMNRVDLLLVGAFFAMLGIGRMKKRAE